MANRLAIATVAKSWYCGDVDKRTPSPGHSLKYGEGSFYFRERDQRWVGSFEVGDPLTGKRKRVVVTSKSEDDAWRKLQARRSGTVSARESLDPPISTNGRPRHQYSKDAGAASSNTYAENLERLREQAGCCYYCRRYLADGWTMDHMTPLARGGTNAPDNLTICCLKCNQTKQSKTVPEFLEWARNVGYFSKLAPLPSKENRQTAMVRSVTNEVPKPRTGGRIPKKRHTLPHGEGSFYYSASSGRWVGTVEAGWTATGKRRRVTVTHLNEDAAWDKLQAKRKQILLEGTPSQSAKASTTVKQWIDQWAEDRRSQVKPKTHRTDTGMLRRWVVPAIGKRRLADLGPDDFRKFAKEMRKKDPGGGFPEGRSETTVRHAYRVFLQCLNAAVAEGHSVPATALAVHKPSPADSDRGAMSTEHALALRVHSQESLDGTLWEFLLMTACRLGEALGLRWSDLDLDAHTVTLRWELQELTREPDGTYYVPTKYASKQLSGRFWLLSLKTKKSQGRVVPLPKSLCKRLTKLKAQSTNPHGLVWARPGGEPLIEADVRTRFKAIQTEIGIRHEEADRPYTPHELRHTTVSLLLALGVPIAVIEAIVGHSKLVRDYVHVSQEQMREGIAIYDAKLLTT